MTTSLFVLLSVSVFSLQAADFSASTDVSTTGNFTLEWNTVSPVRLEGRMIEGFDRIVNGFNQSNEDLDEFSEQTEQPVTDILNPEQVFVLNWVHSAPVILYQGNDRQTTLSGLPDGVYEFTLHYRENGDEKSDSIEVIVQHHSLARAFMFFSIGAFVFCSALFIIIGGSRKRQHEEEL